MEQLSRILLVDDNAANLELLEEILLDKYDLCTADSGARALEIAPAFRPEIVLLDIMMPGMNGYEVCRRLKASASLLGTKVILVSAKAMTSERMMGYEAGADDYIVKPFDEEELLAKLRVYMKLKRVEEIDRVKSDLITLLNHETRTPLNAIIAPLQMLMSGGGLAAGDQQELMEIALRSAERLAELLEKALLYSALRAGSRAIATENCELGQVIREALGVVDGRFAAKQIALIANVRTGIEVSIDKQLIRRAVAAILDNAIRHTPVGGEISLDVCQENDCAEIRIHNTGRGVDPEVLPHLFEVFHSPDIMHHSEGQRLSLALVRQIAVGHGGAVDVESIAGEGATFRLRLPCPIGPDNVRANRSCVMV